MGRTRKRLAVSTVAALVFLLIGVIVVGGLSYYVFSSSARSTGTLSTSTSSGTTSTQLTTTHSTGSSGQATSSSGTHTSSESETSTTGISSIVDSTATSDETSTASTSTTSVSSSSTFVVPPGGSEVIIPPGIQNANAKQQNITYDPVKLRVVIGVNNTIYFYDADLQDNLGHVIESNSWPSSAEPFAFDILPGRVANVTLTVPGTYDYNCEWHPVWMDGTIVVVAG